MNLLFSPYDPLCRYTSPAYPHLLGTPMAGISEHPVLTVSKHNPLPIPIHILFSKCHPLCLLQLINFGLGDITLAYNTCRSLLHIPLYCGSMNILISTFKIIGQLPCGNV